MRQRRQPRPRQRRRARALGRLVQPVLHDAAGRHSTLERQQRVRLGEPVVNLREVAPDNRHRHRDDEDAV